MYLEYIFKNFIKCQSHFCLKKTFHKKEVPKSLFPLLEKENESFCADKLNEIALVLNAMILNVTSEMRK